MDFELFNKDIYKNLPKLIKDLTDQFEDREKDLIFLSSVGVISAALPKIYGFYSKNKVFPHLYLMILAPPASGKGVINFSRILIEEIDRKLIKKSKENNTEKENNLQIKIIPGNISSADLYDKIKIAHGGGLIFESEADTINTVMKQDFGDFSDVLRKAFHHESLSISRKSDKQFDKIYDPKLSLVLSGTPDQLQPLIKSTSNGLFSRMVYYFFNEVNDWKDVFQDDQNGLGNLFKEKGKILSNAYGKLFNKEGEIEFTFTKEQKQLFNKEMQIVYEKVVSEKDLVFNASVKRHGIILFRIAMILSAVRKLDELHEIETLECDDKDFQTILKMKEPLIKHAFSVFNLNLKYDMPEIDQKIYKELSKVFSTQELLEVAFKFDIPRRTIFEKRNGWLNKKFVVKVTHGKYRKQY